LAARDYTPALGRSRDFPDPFLTLIRTKKAASASGAGNSSLNYDILILQGCRNGVFILVDELVA
jgi:hypothetical protein